MTSSVLLTDARVRPTAAIRFCLVAPCGHTFSLHPRNVLMQNAMPPLSPKRQQVIFVDVDDTLIRSVGQKRIPMPSVVAEIRVLYDSGAALYLWSSGGGEYARESAIELKIEHLFVAFLPKPDAYIDDQAVHEWRFCRHVLPTNADSLTEQPPRSGA